MGLLITTYLIASNVYGELDGPPSRGFSNVEVWITGVQFNFLLALLEYSFLLCMIRFEFELPFCYDIKKLTKIIDITLFVISLSFLLLFNFFYWMSFQTKICIL